MEIKELMMEIRIRETRREEIRRVMDEYCQSRYGIENFSTIVDEIFASQRSFAVCLGRQIPTASIEHLAKITLAAWMTEQGIETEAIPLAFTNDSFSGSSALKHSYVRVPYIDRGRKGIFCKNEKIVEKSERGDLDGRILASIRTMTGQALPEFHYKLREEVLGKSKPIVDISPFFLRFLGTCIQRGGYCPSYVYVTQGDYEKKIPITSLNNQILTRPPADWYYFFHLLMYLDGKRALLFTVGDDDYFQALMNGAIARVQEITGFEPLVIFTPNEVEVDGYKSRHLTEIPRWVLNDPNWRDKIEMPSADNCMLFEAYEYFERQLIELA